MASVARNGRLLAWVVNEDGYSRLRLRDLKKDKKVRLPKLPEGVIHFMAFSPNSRKIAFLMGRERRSLREREQLARSGSDLEGRVPGVSRLSN